MRRVVSVIATGGTIANTPNGRVAVDEVLATASAGVANDAHAEVEVVDLMRVGADDIGPRDWLTIRAEVVRQASRSDVIGVVLTHGTYTVEETAFFLHLATPTPKPIVVTCAQRKFGTLSSDAPGNLRDAIRVALSPDARRRGVMVVVNEQIHSARDVAKTSQRLWGFQAGEAGWLGTVDSDCVNFFRRPVRRHTHRSGLSAPIELPRVDIVATYPGADGAAVDAFVAAGAQGLVVSGFSYRGWAAPGQIGALEDAVRRGIPVVLASRGSLGRIPAEDERFVTADNLTPQKARILLMLALDQARDRVGLQAIYDSY